VAGARGPLDVEARSAHPISDYLPSLFHDNEFMMSFVAGLDEVLAPVFMALDSLPAYLDPEVAPDDFVDFLGDWVGAELDPAWPIEKRREVVANAAALQSFRGTRAGLAAQIQLLFGVESEILDSGGVSSSAAPGGPLPGDDQPRMLVRLRVADPSSIDVRRLDALVRSSKPAHVVHEIEVVGT
jgi:phage tail-like protein